MDNGILTFCLNVGDFAVNTYVLACPKTREGVIIDPGGEDKNQILPRYIINTHGHRDHDYGTPPFSTIGREMEENIYITNFM